MAGKVRKKGQDQFVLAVAGGSSITAAAERAGISERQAFRRTGDPEFRQELARLRAEMFDRAAGRLADGTVEAADTLRSLLSTDTPGSLRLTAAKAVLELGSKLRESLEVEERLQKLEGLFDERNRKQTDEAGTSSGQA